MSVGKEACRETTHCTGENPVGEKLQNNEDCQQIKGIQIDSVETEDDLGKSAKTGTILTNADSLQNKENSEKEVASNKSFSNLAEAETFTTKSTENTKLNSTGQNDIMKNEAKDEVKKNRKDNCEEAVTRCNNVELCMENWIGIGIVI